MNHTERFASIGVLIFWVIILMVVLLTNGCQLIPMQPTPTTPSGVELEALKGALSNTSWLTTVGILGAAIALAAFVNGNKWAIPILIGSLAATGLSLAVAQYATIIGLLSLAGAVGVFVWSVYRKNKAFFEVVRADEGFKKCIDDSWPDTLKAFKMWHTLRHSNSTNALVAEARVKAKRKDFNEALLNDVDNYRNNDQ